MLLRYKVSFKNPESYSFLHDSAPPLSPSAPLPVSPSLSPAVTLLDHPLPFVWSESGGLKPQVHVTGSEWDNAYRGTQFSPYSFSCVFFQGTLVMFSNMKLQKALLMLSSLLILTWIILVVSQNTTKVGAVFSHLIWSLPWRTCIRSEIIDGFRPLLRPSSALPASLPPVSGVGNTAFLPSLSIFPQSIQAELCLPCNP